MSINGKKIENLKVTELKVELGKRGLSKSGLKDILAARLLESVKKDTTTPATSSAPVVINLESAEDEEVRPGKRVKSSNGERKKRKGNEEDTSGTSSVRSSRDSLDRSNSGQLVEFDRIRVGSASFGDNKGTLEVSNAQQSYSYHSDYVYSQANVKVKSGIWYYEVKLLSTRYIQVGWGTSDFNTKNGTGDYWVFCTSEQHKQRNNQAYTKYGEHCGSGDVIGCSLDVEGKTIRFWRNGKELGVAYNDVVTNAMLTPFVGLGSEGRVLFNFGAEGYQYPQEGYNQLHTPLGEPQIAQLGRLFIKYRDIGNKDAEEPKETIHGQGMLEFQKDLGVTDEEDPVSLILAWKLKASTLWEISADEFMNWFYIYGCSTIDNIKSAVREWKKDLKTKDNLFRTFYNFVFEYLKEDKLYLILDTALVAWNIVLKDRSWCMREQFYQFLKDSGKKSITKDAWQQLWHFMQTYPDDLKDYDPSSCWPMLYDEFVEYVQEKSKK